MSDDPISDATAQVLAALDRLTDEQRALVKGQLYDLMCMECWRKLAPGHRCYCHPRYDE